MNREIVIGQQYTSIIGTQDDTYQLERNVEYNENKPVSFEPLCRRRTIKTKDFLNGLKTNLLNNTEILPIGCKYFQTFSNGRKLLVIEEPPRIRTIKVEIGQEATIEKLKLTGKLKEYGYENYLVENKGVSYHSFQLSFPYVVFIILLNKNNGMVQMQPFFRLHPITSLSDYLFKAPLYNIPDGQTICLGSLTNFPTVLETTENIIETFWLNKYNKDYTDNISAYQNSEAYEVHDYLSWQYFSKVNPMFIYNVNWIKYSRNLGRIINYMREYSEESRNSSSSYDLLHNVVSGATSTELSPSPGVRNLTYSIAVEGATLEVGDEIIFDNEKKYLYSITTSDNGESYNAVELENEKGELISVPYREFIDGINDLFTIPKIDEIEVNGKVIKPDDIITYKSGDYEIHKRIKSIRIAQDGKVEVLIGSDHYLIENIDFEVMDLNEVKINNQPLDKEKDYFVISSSDRYNNAYKTRKMKFHHVTISSSGSIILRFVPTTSRGSSINLNYRKYQDETADYDFIDPTRFITPDVLCHFDKLLFNSINENDMPKFKFIRDKGIFVDTDSNIRYYRGAADGAKQILEKILIADGTRLYIPRVQCDVDFKVGDPIVYANWDQPEDMFIISSIDSFEYDETANRLFIHSTSLNKKVQFKIPYINFGNDDVNIGAVRKVESQCGEWRSGDKIKAGNAGITNFPKKDTNSIIAFINDGATKYPLALCSNLCTLWMNEESMSKFKRLPFKSAEWYKHEITPIDVDKIKWQHGDHFVSDTSSLIKFLGRRQGTKYAFEYHYATNQANLEWGNSISKNELSDYTRHGFLMPRITASNPRAARNKTGFPNMLGGYMLDGDSRVYIRSEQFKEEF